MTRLAVVLVSLATLFALAPPATAASGPIIVIFMENHERSSIEKSADAVYLKSFEANGTSFTNYYAVAHPSLPNYLAFASGSTKGKVGTDSISAGEILGANIWGQAQAAGVSWGVYEESMPSVCSSVVGQGSYALRHNPATPFHNIFTKPVKCNKVVPYTQFSTSNLPSLSFITPNTCNDMHSCSIATGDNWLAANVPPILAAGATVVITFDEGSSNTNGGGNVYTAVDGPGIAPSVDTATYNHYSLLAGLELRIGVKRLGGAATATPLPLG
jgi:hypothetical protein